MKTKVCTKCGKEKPLSEFHKRKESKDGYKSRCKECIKEIDHEYRLKSVEKRRLRWIKYYKNKKEDILQQQKRYREENKDKVRDYQQQYRKDHPNYWKEYIEKNKQIK